MYDRGFYSYKDANKDIKTHYYIEYTRDHKVFDIMDTVFFCIHTIINRVRHIFTRIIAACAAVDILF